MLRRSAPRAVSHRDGPVTANLKDDSQTPPYVNLKTLATGRLNPQWQKPKELVPVVVIR